MSRELLKQARYAMECGNVIACDDAIKAIDAFLAREPDELARELAMKVLGVFCEAATLGYAFFPMPDQQPGLTKAAAILAPYLTEKTVLMGMLEEIFEQWPCYIPGKEPNAVRICIDVIAAKHGYKVV